MKTFNRCLKTLIANLVIGWCVMNGVLLFYGINSGIVQWANIDQFVKEVTFSTLTIAIPMFIATLASAYTFTRILMQETSCQQ